MWAARFRPVRARRRSFSNAAGRWPTWSAGTRPDVTAIAAVARAVGALVYVDGVHATPHGPVDVAALGADFYVTSAYKWSGPHVGALIAAPSVLAALRPDKLASSPDTVPERF